MSHKEKKKLCDVEVYLGVFHTAQKMKFSDFFSKYD